VKVGDLVQWNGEPDDDDLGIVISLLGTTPLAEIFWFREQDFYRYEVYHPNVVVISEHR